MKAIFLLFVLANAASAQESPNLCKLVSEKPGAVAARETGHQVLHDLEEYVDLQPGTIELYPSYSILVKQNAWAQNCDETGKQYIFYDPDYFSELTTPTQERDWIKYFIFAHEVGHIQNQHTRGANSSKDPKIKELEADEYAGYALGLMHASVDQIVLAVDKINPADRDEGAHPSRCKRRAQAVAGFNRAARILKTARVSMCGCTVAAGGPGIYVVALRISANSALQESDVQICTDGTSTPDRPLSWTKDLAGFCSTRVLPAGTLLTWDNIGFCR